MRVIVALAALAVLVVIVRSRRSNEVWHTLDEDHQGP
jgi:hypothetical protein